VAFPWTEVATIAAAAGAGAAWRSAGASRQAVARANRPFVWPSFFESTTESELAVSVQVHNDGPGVALDVRWSLAFFDEHDSSEDERRSEELTGRLASEPSRGLRARDSSDRRQVSIPEERQGHFWFVVVRYTDSAGVRWEYAEPWDVGTLADPVRRLRKVRGYRGSRRWWLRRLKPRRPVREWLMFREPPDW